MHSYRYRTYLLYFAVHDIGKNGFIVWNSRKSFPVLLVQIGIYLQSIIEYSNKKMVLELSNGTVRYVGNVIDSFEYGWKGEIRKNITSATTFTNKLIFVSKISI